MSPAGIEIARSRLENAFFVVCIALLWMLAYSPFLRHGRRVLHRSIKGGATCFAVFAKRADFDFSSLKFHSDIGF